MTKISLQIFSLASILIGGCTATTLNMSRYSGPPNCADYTWEEHDGISYAVGCSLTEGELATLNTTCQQPIEAWKTEIETAKNAGATTELTRLCAENSGMPTACARFGENDACEKSLSCQLTKQGHSAHNGYCH